MTVSGKELRNGSTKSCGCLRKETTRATGLAATTHGHARHGREAREYNAWRGMKKRCYMPSHSSYPNYGGRGIAVCERWIDSFETFLADMGPCPPGHTIDRIDNNGHYEAGNCRWATWTQQANNRRGNLLVCVDGQTMTLKEATRSRDISYTCVQQRLASGWPLEAALSLPSDKTQRFHKT